MDIKEALEKAIAEKRQLEYDIAELLKQFTDSTGMQVMDIQCNNVETTTTEDTIKTYLYIVNIGISIP